MPLTTDTQAAKPQLPAPEEHREYGPRGQRWTPYPHTRAHSTWAAGPDSPREKGSRMGESARPRTPLATGPPRIAGVEHLLPTRTRECRPAEPAYELSHPRPAAPTAPAPATGNPHPTPSSWAQRHNNGGTCGPTQNTPPIPGARRSTRGHEGAGAQRRRRRPPKRGRGHGLRPGGHTRALHGKHARRTYNAGGQRAHPLPRLKTGPLHRRKLGPQTAPPARHDDGAPPKVGRAAARAALRYGVAQGWILDETARGSVNIQEAVDRVTHAGQGAVTLHTRGRHGGPLEGIIVEPSEMVLVLAADMVRGALHASRVRRARPLWTIQVYTPPRAWPFSTLAVLAVMWHLAPEDAPTETAEEIAWDLHTWPAGGNYPWRRPRGALQVAPAAEGLSLAATLQRHPDKRARPPSRWAVGGGGAPDLRRPPQRRKAPPPGDAFPPPPQRATPARKGAGCGTAAGSPDGPRNGGRPAPPGAAPHHPLGTQLPQGMQAEETVPGPHTRMPAPTACGWQTLTARPEGRRPGEEQRLTPDAPRNGGGPPPWGRPPPPPRSVAPTGHASRGDSAEPPYPHTPAHSKCG